MPRPETSWRPPESLPELSQFKRIWFDTEGTGLDMRLDKPIGTSFVLENDKRYYLPWGHEGGGNLDERLIKRWAERELRGKDLVFLNAKHDNHQFYNWGLDLEAQGNRLHDVSFKAALINENRYGGLDLNSLGKEFVGRGKAELQGVDKSRMRETSAGEVAPYAIEDAVLVRDIDLATDKIIDEEELRPVLELEDSLIYAVCEMERNGAPLDIPKLQRWCRQAKEEVGNIILEIYRLTGYRVNPNSPVDLSRIFKVLGLTNTAVTATGDESFTDDVLKGFKQHPVVALILRGRHVDSVHSKFLSKYLKAQRNGILYYNLHQLKTDEGGTITGRFSSSGPKSGGANIQQVPRVKDQFKRFGNGDYCIRELFIEEPGYDFCASDAAQIEFRLFAHYANSPRLNDAYAKDRKSDFHNLVLSMVQQSRADCNRDEAKEGNFATIYGSGADTLAATLGIMVSEAREFLHAYNGEFPEAKRLMNQAMNVAQRRSYVKTILGRRGRFPLKDRYYKALNKVIQGGAADLNKLKLRRVYNERKTIGIYKLRMTVHDEVVSGRVKDPVLLQRYEECMDVQEYPLRVPIIWETKVGENWKQCK